MSPSPARGGANIAIRDLRKHYELRPHGEQAVRRIDVLNGVDLDVGAGEMVSVVGASGVGKSTLLHVLGALDTPTTGSIVFDGQELTKLTAARLADFRNREVGFVFQFHHLLPEFTALENVMMPALIQRIARADADARARAMLERVGLSQRLDHRPGELSGGEQQRVALARALLLSPRLLLADEPTGNLDTRTGASIHGLLEELNRELGMTMLVVTHNPDLAQTMQRQLRMIDGRIVDDAGTKPGEKVARA
jgi:lipoprotein-releasing system ATP-binding protein